MSKVIKTAIAIPKAEYQKMEVLRVQMGMTRSQLLVEAFNGWVTHRERLDLERRYAAGYKKHPEKASDVGPLTQAGLEAWEKESWD